MLNANLLLPFFFPQSLSFSFLFSTKCPNPNHVIGVHTHTGQYISGWAGCKGKQSKKAAFVQIPRQFVHYPMISRSSNNIHVNVTRLTPPIMSSREREGHIFMIATLHPKQLIIVNIDLNNLGKREGKQQIGHTYRVTQHTQTRLYYYSMLLFSDSGYGNRQTQTNCCCCCMTAKRLSKRLNALLFCSVHVHWAEH